MAGINLSDIPAGVNSYEKLAVWAVEGLARLAMGRTVGAGEDGAQVPAASVAVLQLASGRNVVRLEAFPPCHLPDINSATLKTWQSAGPLVGGTASPGGTEPPTPPLTDPLWSSVSFLLQPTGAVGSVTVADSSLSARPLTTIGTPTVAETPGRFSGKAWLFPSGVQTWETPNNVAFQFGTGDFTVEAQLYTTGAVSYIPVFDARGGATHNNYVCGVWLINGVYRPDFLLGNPNVRLIATARSVQLNTEVHIAWVRQSGVLSVYVDGIADPTTLTYQGNINPTGSQLYVGRIWDGVNFAGEWGPFRITKAARYLSNFTPPKGNYPVGA